MDAREESDSTLWRVESRAQLLNHAAAIPWRKELPPGHALLWLPQSIRERTPDEHSLLHLAHEELFSSFGLPEHTLKTLPPNGVRWRRNPLGKPYVHWTPEMVAWARPYGMDAEHFHLSNTHDGDATLLLALYSENVIGLGIDLVDLERLKSKDRIYFLRFARRFMSEDEYRSFEVATERENTMEVLFRVAAHFSLMEAASKALGTGLKIGMGMGTSYSLPMQSIVVKQVAPSVRLGFVGDAMRRLKALEAHRIEAFVAHDTRYLVSVVLLHGHN